MSEPITHEAWQQQITDLARMLGWEWLHVRRSIGKGKRWTTATNVVGWVDLFLWNPKHGGVLAVELKVGKDRPTDAQAAVIASLRAAGVPSFVWYPSDLDEAVAVLSAPRVRRGSAGDESDRDQQQASGQELHVGHARDPQAEQDDHGEDDGEDDEHGPQPHGMDCTRP